MTDKQFQQLFAAQLAQIALLQAIEANVSFMAHKHVPTDRFIRTGTRRMNCSIRR